ncbi:MAG TPA: DUF86 domain-containing protein [Candidatus Methylomirabilis sp.]|nr:DUF86 domain-containing protein [Candidatus Methylomirabilis sp.]HSB78251.1 DUF86 domain-containing protein [Candidatus Methylomirabilis sp.]HSC69841.1 DUF86 domain-containing protein [Candidatus Methylomirabilis sp.]
MKPKRAYVDYLRDILDAAQKARRFVEGIEFDSFVANDEKVYAVIRALEIVGEAAKKVPKSVQKRYPEVPWPEVAGMRDKLIHGYFGVNLRRVWQTVLEDLPVLQVGIERILADLDTPDSRN